MRFRKIYAVIPQDLYEKLVEKDVFKGDFDGLISNLLIGYLESKGCDLDDSRNGFNR